MTLMLRGRMKTIRRYHTSPHHNPRHRTLISSTNPSSSTISAPKTSSRYFWGLGAAPWSTPSIASSARSRNSAARGSLIWFNEVLVQNDGRVDKRSGLWRHHVVDLTSPCDARFHKMVGRTIACHIIFCWSSARAISDVSSTSISQKKLDIRYEW